MIECKICGNTQVIVELDTKTTVEREGDLPKLSSETAYRIIQINCSKCLSELYCFLHGWFTHVDADRRFYTAMQNLNTNKTQEEDNALLEMIEGVNYEDLIALLQKGKDNEAK